MSAIHGFFDAYENNTGTAADPDQIARTSRTRGGADLTEIAA